MGSAMLKRWHASDTLPTSTIIIKPSPLQDAFASVQWLPHLDDYHRSIPDIILLAVKPQIMANILPMLVQRFGVTPLYITIAAGLTLGFYQQHLGEEARVVRAMPNTPVEVGAGVTTLIATPNVTQAEREGTEGLFGALGQAYWLESEAQMNAATALSGSGPAYAYLFMEALARVGAAQGLPEVLAKNLAVQTLCGAAKLAAKSNESLEALRHHVTSKGGTTEAALQQLQKNDAFAALIFSAVAAAINRAEQLNAADSLS
jgi:pyrroline-5-carboxylate reductase